MTTAHPPLPCNDGMDDELHPIPEKTPRWVLVVLAALTIVGLVAFSRGRDHHHGDDVGALGGPGAAATSGETAGARADR
jgi:hypothetical protein